MCSKNTLDQVILINETDQPLGTMDKTEAHRYPARLHRASSVFLFRCRERSGVELLIQQRSQSKIVGANQWANSVCVNLRPGEGYEGAAQRRLKEELGVVGVSLTDIYHFQYQLQCNEEFGENEIDHVFGGWYDGPIAPNPAEVKNFNWIDFNQLRENQDLELAPWFALMIKDEKLMNKLHKWLKKDTDE